jgi:DNA-binding response OmpR family regulator
LPWHRPGARLALISGWPHLTGDATRACLGNEQEVFNRRSILSQEILKVSRSTHQSSFYDFGSFRIDAANRLLLQAGEIISLQPKTLNILLLLVENRRRVLDKEELMRRVWPDTVVEGANLTQNIYVLRKSSAPMPAGRNISRRCRDAAIASLRQ